MWGVLKGRLGDQTTSVILDTQGDVSHEDVLPQWDRIVGAHLGHGDGGGVVVVHAGVAVDGESVMLTSSVHTLECPL